MKTSAWNNTAILNRRVIQIMVVNPNSATLIGIVVAGTRFLAFLCI